MIFRLLKYLLFIPISLFALEIQRDAVNAFIFTDGVAGLRTGACLGTPENAHYFGSAEAPGIPFRTYIIALPSSLPPSISLENIKSETLSGKPCGAEQNPRSLQVGSPYLKDNLWRVKINVPLVYSNGASWSLRRKFKVLVNFGESPKGFSISKRALAYVENKAAATKFGIKQTSVVRTLQKPSAANMDGIDWIARIGIGTKDLTEMADGMYALSFDDLRAIAGSDIDGIPISNLRLFSAPPDTLTEMLGEETFPNAEEIPIIVKDGKNDNTFNSGDSIIFFGYGTALWKKSNSTRGMDYYFSHSPYSFYQYFYLGAGGKGKNLSKITKNISNPDTINWKKYARSEKDLILRDHYFANDANAIEENTGKEWFWKWGIKDSTVAVEVSEFQNSVRKLNGLRGDSLWLGVSFLTRRSSVYNETFSSLNWKKKMEGIKFNFYFQGKKQENIIDTIEGGSFVFASNGAQQNDNLYRLEISSSGQPDRFDGLSIAYRYNVNSSVGDEWLFPGNAKGAVKIPIPANMQLLKTKNSIPIEILEKGNDTISIDGDTKYFLFKENSYKKPAFVEAIPKRASSVSEPLKIHPSTEYLILTSEKLQNSAISLKQFRESEEAVSKFNTAVVLTEDIYRNHGAKFSPVAIRDYIRYAKNNCPNLKYVFLAGGGNYDYRKIRPNSKDNLIPPYEAEDMSTDDFFAVLDSGEAIRFGKYELSLAIGRLPVLNAAEFDHYIQKAKDYEKVSIMDNGIWRNTVILNADDATQAQKLDHTHHTQQMENTAVLVDSLLQNQNFAIDWRKISLLQYDLEGGNKKPGAAKELLLRLNQGALFTFYYGHGNAVQWADEDLLNTSSLGNIFNEKKYTILGSFSCLVARFDDAAQISLSETFVNAKSKGAIAAIGSLRESYASHNVDLATKILKFAMITPNALLGEAILKSKLSSSYSFSPQRYNNEKYVLLGEPVLSMPKQEIGLNFDSIPDAIQALQKLKISGTASVQSGKVRLQVLEGEKSRHLEQKNCKENFDNDFRCSANIKIPGNPIYSEELQIENKKFSTEFITPRKLSLGDTSAQIRLWAYKAGEAEIGRVAKKGISLSGTSSYADSIKDNSPPSIKIYPCLRAGKTNPYSENSQVNLEIPACLDVVIEDSTGIDYREEADEGISFELSPAASSWHPWSFSEQTGKRAVTRVNFGLSYDPGNYIFKVRSQDILGNIALRSIKLSLNKENRDGLTNVFNIPNPMKNTTTFYFKDLAGDGKIGVVNIKIFDQNGNLVKVMNNVISGESSWDGRDSRGRLLANGLYHYVVQNTISSLENGGKKKVFEKKQKLIISR
ncbi:MAG: C25 family cysteine peptidase [Fibromonadales bacterium]|nr:C25 family cysteine peptidase [Fibromonadales bacterium]